MNEKLRFRLIAAALFVFCSAWLYWAAAPRFEVDYLEDDLLWMVPVIVQETGGQGPAKALDFVFNLSGEMGVPSLNASLYALVQLFGARAGLYNLTLFFLHLGVALALFAYVRLGLRAKPWTALAACLLFLTAFSHWHAYLWAVAVQHLWVVLFALAVLTLYFRAADAPDKGGRYWTLLAVALPSFFLRESILVVPFVMFVHALAGSDSKGRFFRFFPLYAGYALFPCVSASHGAMGHRVAEALPLYALAGHLGFAGGLLLWAVAVLALAGLGFSLGPLSRLGGRTRLFVLGLPSACVLGWLGVSGTLRASDVLYPALSGLGLLLDPFAAYGHKAPLARWHLLGLEPGGLAGGLLTAAAVAVLFVFLDHALRRDRRLLALPAWLGFVCLFFAFSPDKEIPSRYYYYLTPALAPILAIILLDILPGLARGLKRPRLPGIALGAGVAVIAVLLAANTDRIRRDTELTRLFPDNAWSYDYIKWATLIQDHFRALGGDPADIRPVTVSELVTLLPSFDIKHIYPDWDMKRFHPAAFIYQGMLGTTSCSPLAMAMDPEGERPMFSMQSTDIIDGKGRLIEPFAHDYLLGMLALFRSDRATAIGHLGRAVREQPFFLRQVGGLPGLAKVLDNAGSPNFYDMLEGMYSYYNGGDDLKYNYMAHMLAEEAQRYATALTVLHLLNGGSLSRQSDEALAEDLLLLFRPETLQERLFWQDIKSPGIKDQTVAFMRRVIPQARPDAPLPVDLDPEAEDAGEMTTPSGMPMPWRAGAPRKKAEDKP